MLALAQGGVEAPTFPIKWQSRHKVHLEELDSYIGVAPDRIGTR